MQLRPFAVDRVRTAASDHPLMAVELAAGERPAFETVRVEIGPGFRSVAEVTQVLREVANRLESGRAGGFQANMEEEVA